ncbi:MAG: hypothetical protein HYY84_03835 [Deltaproteobacteria bacterium]|nr:hypothetical protein [Deltaproteobacteria bacterium]
MDAETPVEADDERAGLFPVTDCAPCGLTQLLVAEYGADEEPVRRCASCGAAAPDAAVRWVSTEALAEVGWGVVEEQKKKSGGCCKTGGGCGCAAKKKARKAGAGAATGAAAGAEAAVVADAGAVTGAVQGRFRVFQ